MEETEIDILIAKVLSGEATPQEQLQLTAWRSQHSDNEFYFKETSRAFDLFSGVDFAPKIDAAWEKVNDRLRQKEGKIISLFSSRKTLRVAAAILLFASLSVVISYFMINNATQEMSIVADIHVKQQELPDGSSVRVEKNSSLIYSEEKNGERVVKLKGAAFFKVVHDDKKPFVVQVQDVLVKDIGTEFKVTESADGNKVEVKVDEGEVQFYSAKSQGMRLVKGESAVYDRMADVFRKSMSNTTESAAGFGSKSLQFSDSRLIEIITRINAAYGSHVILEDANAGDCRLTVNFENQPFETVMDVITETLELERRKQGDTLILSGNGCK